MLRVGVIGGGAAGFFAAIQAAKNGAKVTLIEKTSNVLAKVKISGGGRCNVTHAAYVNSRLVKNYPRGEKFLKKVFDHFSVKETQEWFESRGVKLKVEADGRMFPVSDDSQTIIDVLISAANAEKVEVLLSCPIREIHHIDGKFQVVSNKRVMEFDRLIVSTGGHPKLLGFEFIQKLGHQIVFPIPSLFTFNTPEESIRKLMGISVPDAHIRLEGTKLAYRGPLLITHWGVSGPAVLKLSAFGAQWLYNQDYHANAHIRWINDYSERDFAEGLMDFKLKHPKKKVVGNPIFGLPGRLWEHLIEKSDINIHLLWHETSKKQLNKLVQNLFSYIVCIKGKTAFKDEFVTSGGVELNEVNPETMESKLIRGLFFAGEVLNIDGITGGFNFQAAWSTGYLAGSAVNKPF